MLLGTLHIILWHELGELQSKFLKCLCASCNSVELLQNHLLNQLHSIPLDINSNNYFKFPSIYRPIGYGLWSNRTVPYRLICRLLNCTPVLIIGIQLPWMHKTHIKKAYSWFCNICNICLVFLHSLAWNKNFSVSFDCMQAAYYLPCSSCTVTYMSLLISLTPPPFCLSLTPTF